MRICFLSPADFNEGSYRVRLNRCEIITSSVWSISVCVSDPSEPGCHVSSATPPGLPRPAPSLLPLTLKITWREFFNRQKTVIHKDGFALVLTKAGIVTNEGLASARIRCAGSGASPPGDALTQHKVGWTGRGEEGLPLSPCTRALLLLDCQQTGLWSWALACSHGIWMRNTECKLYRVTGWAGTGIEFLPCIWAALL